MSSTRNRKRSGGSKPIDLAVIRRALEDRRTWIAQGLVVRDESLGSHFEIDDGDVLVEVQLADTGIPVTCRLASTFAGAGVGLFMVPDEGTEVLVAIPKGEIDGEPAIVAMLSTGELPDGFDGSNVVLVVKPGAKLLVHDGDAGGCKQLVTKDDFDGHTHPLPIITAPNGACTIGAATPSPGNTGGAPAATGTQVLKSK